MRTGLTESFHYARMRDVREGVMADDGNLGGSRVKGATISGDLKTDSPASSIHGLHGMVHGPLS